MTHDQNYYEQQRDFAIAVEILVDPCATVRERVLAQRIYNKDKTLTHTHHGESYNPEHCYDF